jgi:WD40 repeat protein
VADDTTSPSPDGLIDIHCPNCDATYSVPAQALGRKTNCTKCQTLFVIEKDAAPDSGPDFELDAPGEAEGGWSEFAGRNAPQARAGKPSPERRKKKAEKASRPTSAAASRKRLVSRILGLVVVPCVALTLAVVGGIWWLLSPPEVKPPEVVKEEPDLRPNLDTKDVVGLYVLEKNPKCRVVVSPGGDVRVFDQGNNLSPGMEGDYTIQGHHLLLAFSFAPTINGEAFGDKPSVEIVGDRLVHRDVGTFVRQASPWVAGGTPVPPLADLQGNGPLGKASLLVLGPLDSHPVRGLGISADGSTVVGETSTPPGQVRRPFRWTKQGGYIDLGWPEEGQLDSGSGRAASSDGSAVAGDAYLPSSKDGEAVRFSSSGTHCLLPRKDRARGAEVQFHAVGSRHSTAYAISADGSVLAGSIATPRGLEAFRWTQADGPSPLGTLLGPNKHAQSQARAVSGDGAAVVGEFGGLNVAAQPGSDDLVRAFRWTKDGGMKELAAAPGYKGFSPATALAVSADGGVVVGVGRLDGQPQVRLAYRWTEAGSAVPLDDLPEGVNNAAARALSADGSVAAGFSFGGNAVQRAAVWESKTGVHDLRAALARDYGLNLEGWNLQSVQGVSADGRTLMGVGAAGVDLSRSPADATRTWVVTLNPGGDALFSRENVRESPKPAPAEGAAPAQQLAKVRLPDLVPAEEFVRHPNNNQQEFEISPDGKLAAASNDDGEVRVWQVDPAKELATLKTGQNWIGGLAFSPDGKWLVTCGQGPAQITGVGSIKVWNLAAGKEVVSLQGPAKRVKRALFSPDGKVLAAVDFDGVVRLWDVVGWKPRLPAAIGGIPTELAFSADGSLLAVAGYGGLLRLIDVRSGKERARPEGVDRRSVIACLAFSRDGATLATAVTTPSGSDVVLWDVAKSAIRTAYPSRSVVSSLSFSADNKLLAAGCVDGTVKLWDPGTGTLVAASDEDLGRGSTQLKFLPDGKLLGAFDARPGRAQPVLFKFWTSSIP